MQLQVCIPYRSDGGYRDRIFEYTLPRWSGLLPGVPVSIGDHEGEPLNRSRARNRSAQGSWDIAIFSDADNAALSERPIRRAITKAGATKGMVYAHDVRLGLDENATEDVLTGRSHLAAVHAAERDMNTFSGIWVIHRDLWETLGGFDEKFQGWGFEDLCFMHAAGQLGSVNRVAGIVYHLWHPRPAGGDHDHEHYRANEVLWHRYLAALGDRQAMHDLVWEGR